MHSSICTRTQTQTAHLISCVRSPFPVCLSQCAFPNVQELGAAALSKRPTSCMLVLPKPPKGGADDEEAKEFAEAYAEAEAKIKKAMPVF